MLRLALRVLVAMLFMVFDTLLGEKFPEAVLACFGRRLVLYLVFFQTQFIMEAGPTEIAFKRQTTFVVPCVLPAVSS